MKRQLVVIALLFSCSVPLLGQIEIEPDTLDFGNVGVSLVGMDYGRGFIVRNVSDSVWWVERAKQPVFAGEEYEFGLFFEGRLGYSRLLPGDSVRFLVGGSVGAHGETVSVNWRYGEFMDTAWIPAESENGVRDTFEFFVRANVVKQDAPSISTSKGATVYKCRCGVRDELPVNSTEYRTNIYVNNPTEDTIWIDSLQLVNLDEVGWWFTIDPGTIITFDSIGRRDIRTGKSPPSHWSIPPTYILPGMPAILSAGLPAYKGTGMKATVVEAWLSGKNGEAWYVQDTMIGWLEELPHTVPVSSFSATVTMPEGVDLVDKGAYASYHKCKLPDSIPVYVTEVEFRGKRADALRLISNAGAPIPELPMQAECVGGDLTWGIEVRRTPKLLGLTVDTLVAHWYYDDPVEGRVEGEAHGLIYITIEGTLSATGEEQRGVPGHLVVRPNPVGEVLDIAWKSSDVQEVKRVGFVLYDEGGRKVVAFGGDREGRGMIQVSGLPAGVYIAVAYDETGKALGAETVVKE
ncbi:MAG: hypothetical protein R3F28_16535 [Candidatus Kapaibacterium sp.]|nr:T9SS type A sorting domain-containing protein [Ignavibacteria bacterium]